MKRLLPLFLFACESETNLPRVLRSGDGFFDRPWPSATRMIDGRPDLEDFTAVAEYPLLETFMEEGRQLDGFGTNSPIFLRFDAPVDTNLLPSPAESRDTDSVVFLVNIDPGSPDRGELTAIEWDFQETATRWQPENLLAVQPVWGMPLRPATEYALVLTSELAARDPEFTNIGSRSIASATGWQDLADTLRLLHVDQDRIAFATQFRTQDTTSEMARLVHRVQEAMHTDILDQQVSFLRSNQWYSAWRGHTRVPIFQHGEPPYLTEGGGLEFDENGWPILASWETVDFVLSVPTDQEEPEDGWPVVLYSHGTGGSATGFADGNTGLEVASMLANAGAIGIGISLPFHGDRGLGVDPSLISFNYFNATAGRSNFRQAALEQIWIIETLFDNTHHFWGSSETEDVAIDIHSNPNALAYMGHSHGAEIGIIAAPFLGNRTRGIVLSGGGGGLSISAVHRSADDYPIQELLRDTFEFLPDEELDEFHPVIGMVQFIAEATDPINYGPYWHRWEPNWNAAPINMLMFEGLLDVYTPPGATEALAGAAHIPILSPVEQRSTVQELLAIDGVDSPASQNSTGWDGSLVTTGLAQYDDYGHFTIFNEADAARRYRDFLQTALYDRATITSGER